MFNYERRIEKIRKIIYDKGLDGALVYGDTNVNYLSGFVPYLGKALILIEKDAKTIFIQFEWEKHLIPNQDEYKEIHVHKDYHKVLNQYFNHEMKIGLLGYDSFPLRMVNEINKTNNVAFESLDGDLRDIRLIKDEEEIVAIRKAVQITEDGIEFAISQIKEGISEKEVANLFKEYVFDHGASDLSFEPTIAFGENSREVASTSYDKILEKGQVFMYDIGAKYDGYVADIGRTFFFGEPDEAYLKIFNGVKDAMETVLDHVKPGVVASDLHVILTQEFEKAGLGVMRHRIGHGLGLNSSLEAPCLETDDIVLKPGMTIAVEVSHEGLPGRGVKIEDNVLVTEDGCEVFNKASRELRIL